MKYIFPNRSHVFRRRRVLVSVLLLVGLLTGCVSISMSDKKISQYFATQTVKPTFGVIRVQNQSVHFATIGADTLPTVLFVHGSPGSWDAFIGFFADSTLYTRARLVSVDRPGFGKSGKGKPVSSIQTQAACLAPLLRPSKAGEKTILVGHSLGGPVAVRVAMDYPDEVGGLILVAPSVNPGLEKEEWYRPLGAAVPFRWLLPAELDVSNREIMPLKGELQKMLPLWAGIRVPVTIIQGKEDELVPPGNADFAKRMLVNAPATIQMIPDMNHFIPWSRPDLIHDAIIKHLETPQ